MRSFHDFKIMWRYEVLLDNKIIGSAQVSDEPAPGQDPNTRYVTVVTIDKEYQRKVSLLGFIGP